jgi:hypothetical protein
MRKISTAAVLAVLLAGLLVPVSVDAQSIGFWNRECKKGFAEVKKKPRHRAFAVSVDAQVQGGQACGWTWSNPTKAAAEKNALQACKKQGQGSCRVIFSD